jgi:hypothetical protein
MGTVRPFSLLAACALVVLGAGASTSLGASAAGPILKNSPTEVGAAVVGQRLTGEPGTWSGTGTLSYAYQWHRCDATGAKCTSVTGATGQSYKVVAKDAGDTLGLTVAATDSTGTTSGYANLIGPISDAASPLVSTIQPAVTGAAQGQSLQVSDGAWSPKPTLVTYAWQRCSVSGRLCTPIANATTSSYIAGADDIGHALLALVTGTSGATTVAALSTIAAVVGVPSTTSTTSTATTTGTTTKATTTSPGKGPSETAAPLVTGSAAVGDRLTGGFGAWTGIGTLVYAYQWHRCDITGANCTSIHGATNPTYLLVTKDAGQTIGLTVTASDSAGATGGYAALVGPIAPGTTSVLISTTQPAITGTAKQGQILLVSNGVWSSTPTSYTYAWQRCNANGRLCAAIPGATKSTYTLVAADAGHTIVAVVAATAGTASQSAFSAATAPIA